ncbi:MAG TPA: hypothetical protein VFA37_02060 [Gaiellaceae bacterium]|nr:hypothetical protein [Gaiellaceae bacterium]
MVADGVNVEFFGSTAVLHLRHPDAHGKGEKLLVVGGDDGLTVLVTKSGKIIVIQPEGPLPGPELGEAVGMIRRGTETLLGVAESAAAEYERV